MTSPRRYPLVVGEAATDISRLDMFPAGERVIVLSIRPLGDTRICKVKRESGDEALVLEGFLQAGGIE